MEAEMERRVQERYVVRQFWIDRGRERTVPYRVVNLSGSGCAVESRSPLLEEGGKVLLEVPLPSMDQGLRLEAKVVWARRLDSGGGASSFLFGFRFREMDHLSRLILDAYLGFLRRDAHIAQLEDAWQKLKKVQERIEILIACEEKKEVSYLH